MEKFKEIHEYARGQPNHSHELLRSYDGRIPITAAKKKNFRKRCAKQVIPPKLHDRFASSPTLEKQEIVFQNQQLKIQGRTMITSNH